MFLPFYRSVLFVTGTILVVFGGWATWSEARVFLSAATNPEARFEGAVNANFVPGLSQNSRTIVLYDCDNVLKSSYSKQQPRERRDKAMSNCLDFALASTRSNPADGMGWFMAALASAWLGEMDDMNSYLATSHSVSANRMTLSTARTTMMATMRRHLDERSLEVLNADIASLTNHADGIKRLVTIYNSKPAIRDTIIAIVETAKPSAQRLFLAETKRTAFDDSGS